MVLETNIKNPEGRDFVFSNSGRMVIVKLK